MKTVKLLGKRVLGTIVIFALAIFASPTFKAAAADDTKPMPPMKGGEHLRMLNKIETKAEADALQPDDTIAMVCAKCKTVYTTRVKQGAHGAQLLMEGGQPKELIGTHGCGGCNSTITVVGQGKGKEMALKHSCGSCGDDSAFCCATKHGDHKEHATEKK